MKMPRRTLALVAAVLCGAALAQPAAPILPDELVEEAKAAISAVRAVDPPSITRMSSAEVLAIVRRVRVVQLEITQKMKLAMGDRMDERRFKAELDARGLSGLYTETFQRQVRPLEARLSPQEKRALDRELGERYPAYGAYVRRAIVSGVILQLSRPRFDVIEQYAGTRQVPASLDEAKLQALRGQRGVQSADYKEGVFRVVLDEEIHPGGVVELAATPKGDGTLEWRCTSSENIRQFMPAACRQ